MIRVCELLLQIESISKLWLLVTKMKAKVTIMNINKLHGSLHMLLSGQGHVYVSNPISA